MDNSLQQTPYFTPRLNKKIWQEHVVMEIIRKRIHQAVSIRVDTDLPVGVIYSGGLDSSIILEIAASMHPDVTAFTIGLPGSEDFHYSRRFCREKNIRHIMVPFTKQDCRIKTVGETIRKTELSEYLDIINAVISMK